VANAANSKKAPSSAVLSNSTVANSKKGAFTARRGATRRSVEAVKPPRTRRELGRSPPSRWESRSFLAVRSAVCTICSYV